MPNWIYTTLLASIALLPLSAHAKVFAGFGISGGIGSHEVQLSTSSYSVKEDIDTSSANIHIGFLLKNNNRFIISFESLTAEDTEGYEIDTSGMRLDWQFVYGENQVQPYFGLGFGFYSSDDLYEYDTIRSISFQLMGGVKININEQVELDLNVQSQAFAWQDIEYYTGYSYAGTVEQTTTHLSAGIGIDFKF